MRNIQNETLISKAIRERHIIAFDYKEDDEPIRTQRIGNPHAIYLYQKTGNILLDLFQIGGDSSERWEIPAWRQFKVDEMSNIIVLGDKCFETRYDYNPNSKKYLRAL